MANDIRVRTNFVAGALSADMASGATTMNSAGLADLPAIGATEHAALELFTRDATGRVTKKEVVWVTAHTAAATSATIARAKEGTTAQDWVTNDKWVASPIVSDTDVVCTSSTRPTSPFIPMRIYETDTGKWLYWNGSQWTSMPQSAQTLGHIEVATTQTPITTETPLNGLSLTVTVPAGRRIKITGKARAASTVSGDRFVISIKEGATHLNIVRGSLISGGGFITEGAVVTAVVTPTAGSHTYTLNMQVSGSGTGESFASSTEPAFLLVEDITGDPSPVQPASVPVGQLGQAFLTATQSGITTATDLNGMSVNISVPAGRVIRIKASLAVGGTVATDIVRAYIKEGGTNLQIRDTPLNITSGSSGNINLEFSTVISPTAGSHTYKVTLERMAGTGTVQASFNATFPTFMLVEDITPTPAPTNGAPGSTLGYAEAIATQSGMGVGPTDLTGLSVTVTVPAGRRLKITGKGRVQMSNATSGFVVDVREGGTALGDAWITDNFAGRSTMDASVIVTPSAGTHTYKLAATRFIGTATLELQASATIPAFILVEDITANSMPIPVSTGLWQAGNDFPSNPVEGDLFPENDTNRLWIFNGTNWSRIWPARVTTKTGGNGVTTSAAAESTIASIVVPAQNFPYRVEVRANVFHTQTVAGDSFGLNIKNSAAVIAIARGTASVETLQVHDYIDVPGGGSITINVMLYRASGTGTASTFNDVLANFVLTSIEAL